MAGGETLRLAEADRPSEEGEAARFTEGGMVIRVLLCGLQSAPNTQITAAIRIAHRRWGLGHPESGREGGGLSFVPTYFPQK
jgi:hypothetical protein